MRARFLQTLVWPGQRCKVSFKSNLSNPLCMFSLQSCQTCGEPLFGSVDLCQHFKPSCKEKLNTNPFPASSLKTSVPTCSRLDRVSLSSKLWLQKFVLKSLYSVPLAVFTILIVSEKIWHQNMHGKKVTITAKHEVIFPKFTRSYKSNTVCSLLNAAFLSYTFNLVQLHHSLLLHWTVYTPACTAGEQHMKKNDAYLCNFLPTMNHSQDAQ